MNTQNIQKYNHKKTLSLSQTHTYTKGKEVRLDKRTKKKVREPPRRTTLPPSVVLLSLSQCITNIQATFHREKPPIHTSNATPPRSQGERESK
jgi:hypothetical protein